jgi:hypothetical protein
VKIAVKTVRLQGALHGLAELAELLIVHVDDLLIAIPEKAVRQIPDGVMTAVGSGGFGSVVATQVAVDNAWTVLPESKQILLAREGRIELIDPQGLREMEQITVEGLPKGTFGACAEPAGRRVLLVVMREINGDFDEGAVAIADLARGRMVSEKTIRANDELQLLWNAQFRAWSITDTGKNVVWWWDGETPAVRLPWKAAEPAWGRKHPSRELWARLAQKGPVQSVQILESTGKVLAEAPMRTGAFVRNLNWSTSSEERIWGSGVRAIVEMTLDN